MEAILSKILASKVGVAAGGALLGLAFGIGLKIIHAKLPGMIAAWIGKEIDLALKSGDPADDELVLAVCKWVECKIPDQGTGSAKMDLAVSKLTAFIPQLKGREEAVKAIIQAVFDKSKAAIAEHRKAAIGG